MSDAPDDFKPLSEFVRGAWTLLIVQLVVAFSVFVAMSYTSLQLKDILNETAKKQSELEVLQTEAKSLGDSIDQLRTRLQHAHDATPIVRSAINSFHNQRYPEAVEQYEKALRLDPDNSWVRDLMSYSQYMSGRAALVAGQAKTSSQLFQDAVTSIGQVLVEIPTYAGGYVELAIYECARDRADAALAAYDAALARAPDAKSTFAARRDEIPQRCAVLHSRISAPRPPSDR